MKFSKSQHRNSIKVSAVLQILLKKSRLPEEGKGYVKQLLIEIEKYFLESLTYDDFFFDSSHITKLDLVQQALDIMWMSVQNFLGSNGAVTKIGFLRFYMSLNKALFGLYNDELVRRFAEKYWERCSTLFGSFNESVFKNSIIEVIDAVSQLLDRKRVVEFVWTLLDHMLIYTDYGTVQIKSIREISGLLDFDIKSVVSDRINIENLSELIFIKKAHVKAPTHTIIRKFPTYSTVKPITSVTEEGRRLSLDLNDEDNDVFESELEGKWQSIPFTPEEFSSDINESDVHVDDEAAASHSEPSTRQITTSEYNGHTPPMKSNLSSFHQNLVESVISSEAASISLGSESEIRSNNSPSRSPSLPSSAQQQQHQSELHPIITHTNSNSFLNKKSAVAGASGGSPMIAIHEIDPTSTQIRRSVLELTTGKPPSRTKSSQSFRASSPMHPSQSFHDEMRGGSASPKGSPSRRTPTGDHRTHPESFQVSVTTRPLIRSKSTGNAGNPDIRFDAESFPQRKGGVEATDEVGYNNEDALRFDEYEGLERPYIIADQSNGSSSGTSSRYNSKMTVEKMMLRSAGTPTGKIYDEENDDENESVDPDILRNWLEIIRKKLVDNEAASEDASFEAVAGDDSSSRPYITEIPQAMMTPSSPSGTDELNEGTPTSLKLRNDIITKSLVNQLSVIIKYDDDDNEEADKRKDEQRIKEMLPDELRWINNQRVEDDHPKPTLSVVAANNILMKNSGHRLFNTTKPDYLPPVVSSINSNRMRKYRLKKGMTTALTKQFLSRLSADQIPIGLLGSEKNSRSNSINKQDNGGINSSSSSSTNMQAIYSHSFNLSQLMMTSHSQSQSQFVDLSISSISNPISESTRGTRRTSTRPKSRSPTRNMIKKSSILAMSDELQSPVFSAQKTSSFPIDDESQIEDQNIVTEGQEMAVSEAIAKAVESSNNIRGLSGDVEENKEESQENIVQARDISVKIERRKDHIARIQWKNKKKQVEKSKARPLSPSQFIDSLKVRKEKENDEEKEKFYQQSLTKKTSPRKFTLGSTELQSSADFNDLPYHITSKSVMTMTSTAHSSLETPWKSMSVVTQVLETDKMDPRFAWEERKALYSHAKYDASVSRMAIKHQDLIKKSFEMYASNLPNRMNVLMAKGANKPLEIHPHHKK